MARQVQVLLVQRPTGWKGVATEGDVSARGRECLRASKAAAEAVEELLAAVRRLDDTREET